MIVLVPMAVMVRVMMWVAQRMMRMTVMNMTRQRVFAQITPHQKNHTERQDHDPGYQSQPGIKLLRHDVLRSIESDRAEQIHARGVRRGDDQAEQQRMLERAARADEIRRDQSLAMSRLKGVKRAEADGNAERQQNDSQAELLGCHNIRERIARRRLPVGCELDGRIVA